MTVADAVVAAAAATALCRAAASDMIDPRTASQSNDSQVTGSPQFPVERGNGIATGRPTVDDARWLSGDEAAAAAAAAD